MEHISKEDIQNKEKKAIELVNEKRFIEAEMIFSEMSLLENDNPDHLNNLGNVLKEQKKYQEASKAYKKALEMDNQSPDILINLATTKGYLNEFEDALDLYDKGIKLIKRDNSLLAMAYNNQGITLKRKGDSSRALESYKKALSLNSQYIPALYNLALLHQDNGDFLSAIKLHKKVLSIDETFLSSLGKIYTLERYICVWRNFHELNKKDINQIKALGISPRDVWFTFDDPSLDIEIAKNFCDLNFTKQSRKLYLKKKNKIRVGYFSSDFRYHPVSLLLSEVLKLHNREDFVIYAYSLFNLKDDFYTKKIKNAVDKFIDVSAITNRELVDLVRNDDIDIAIDLMGHTQYARTQIFAERIAPIQISFLGYSGTMGSTFMDYIIADKTLIEEKEKDYYSEQILYLEKSAICFDDNFKNKYKQIKYKGEDLPNTGFIFACFNNNYKISPEEFDIWMRLLKKIEGSYLFLKSSNVTSKNNLLKEVWSRDIPSKRILFAEYTDLNNHLARHEKADLFLDTFCYNAGSTAVISLLSGLPLLTLKGKSYHSRMTASLLRSLDLDELIAHNKNEYEEKAYFFATNPIEFKKIKEKLNSKLQNPRYFNSSVFTKNLEMNYKKVYQEFLNKS